MLSHHQIHTQKTIWLYLLGCLVAGLACFVIVLSTDWKIQTVRADEPGYDNHPWINTILFNVLRAPHSYSPSDANFVADHYDLTSAHLWYRWDAIKQRNPRLQTFPIVGVGYQSTWEQLMLEQFYQTHSYTDAEKETMYLHYKCDVWHETIFTPGCNLVDPTTGQCSGQPATGCAASTATQLSQSRVPDPDVNYAGQGWLMTHYLSQVYKDFAVWDLQRMIDLYGDNYPAEGVLWDNILYVGSHEIDKTIEYWGQPDGEDNHQRNLDYHNFFTEVTGLVEQAEGRPIQWLGNVNHMFWIRSDGPYSSWVRETLTHATPESWVFPIQMGEDDTPSWFIDCPDLQEAWQYTVDDGLNLAVMTYNAPFEGQYPEPDQRTKVFSLAKYYLVNNPKLYYGYTQDHWATSLAGSQWNAMADVNLGSPRVNQPGVRDFGGQFNTNRYFDWNNPGTTLSCLSYSPSNLVMARHYENGLVLARWRSERWMPAGNPPAGDVRYNSYIDPRNYPVANPYGQEYYIVEADGSLSADPVSSVTLATNEAAVLLQVCPAGSVSATCGCNGMVLNAGDICTPNERPSMEPINDVTLNEGAQLDIQLRATDADCPDGSCLTFQLVGFDPTQFATITNHANGTATLRLAPGYHDAGEHDLSVRVRDTGSPPAYDTKTFTATITNTLHPPQIAPVGNRSAHEQETLVFTVVATDPYPNDRLILSASNLPEGAIFTDNGNKTGTFQWTPTSEQARVYPNIVFTVRDEDGTTDTETITITILDGLANCTPMWTCGEWGACSDGLQTRTCRDDNHCESDAGRPDEVMSCDSTAPDRIVNLSVS